MWKPLDKKTKAGEDVSKSKMAQESPAVDFLAEFAAGAGHFLNNPLAAISGRAQLLLRDETDPVRRQDLASILYQVQRASEMIVNLRRVACPPNLHKSALLLRAFLETLQEPWRATMAERKIDWQILWNPETDIPIQADATMLRVLFQALIANSLRAIPIDGGGAIALDVSAETNRVAIHISDTGHGIPEEIQPLIFDPYYSSYPSGRGLGFGLTQARQIARAHGGDLVLEPSKDSWATTFCVTLPLTSE